MNKAFRLIRTYHGIRQSQLAEEMGLSKSYLSELESGKKEISIEVLKKYSEHFNMPMSSILFFMENSESPKALEKSRDRISKRVIKMLDWLVDISHVRP